MGKTAAAHPTNWFKTHLGYLVSALVLLLAAYLIGSRAIDTGSLQQYTLTFLLLIIAINRLVHFFRGN